MSELQLVKLAYDLFLPSQEEDITLPPVILLHGMTSSRTSWMDISQVIADATKRKVYALDARNHGESPWTDKEFDYHVMAKDVAKFMDDANISKAVIVGHSMGGKTAMVLALSQGERVEKLVVEDISPIPLPLSERLFPIRYPKLMRESLSHVPKGSDIATAGKIIRKYITSHTPEEHYSKRAAMAGVELPLKMTENGVAWQANIDAIQHAYLHNPKLRQPIEGDAYYGDVLFIYGTKSVYGVAKSEDAILKLFPKAVLSPVEDATHLVHLEYPEEFSAKVVEFIGKK